MALSERNKAILRHIESKGAVLVTELEFNKIKHAEIAWLVENNFLRFNP